MALITCPDCGKTVSDRAAACPDCGCPIGALQGGVLRVECSFFGFFGSCRITARFCGETKTVKAGYYADFAVPADGKDHTATISCSKGLDAADINITVRSGESKKVTVLYDDSKFFNHWRYREEMFITK